MKIQLAIAIRPITAILPSDDIAAILFRLQPQLDQAADGPQNRSTSGPIGSYPRPIPLLTPRLSQWLRRKKAVDACDDAHGRLGHLMYDGCARTAARAE